MNPLIMQMAPHADAEQMFKLAKNRLRAMKAQISFTEA